MNVVDDGLVEIKLKRGVAVVIDAEDYEMVSKYKWHVTHRGYVVTAIPIHRLIVGAPHGKEVDHINGDPLDNRKANLRLCTRSQNIANTRKPRKKGGCHSAFKGVSWHIRDKKWVAKVQPHGKKYSRYCDTELEAAIAYDEMAREHFGEFARLNFPDSEVKPGGDHQDDN